MNLWFLNPPPPLSCWCCNCSVCQISLLLCTLLLQEMNIHGYKGALQNKHFFRNFLPSAWGKGNLVPNLFPAYEMEYIYFAILLFCYFPILGGCTTHVNPDIYFIRFPAYFIMSILSLPSWNHNLSAWHPTLSSHQIHLANKA
jgi:hypothetical protein